MPFIKYSNDFKVQILESKVRNSVGDKISTYKIMSKKSESDVKKFCMEKLDISYKKCEMPNLFSPLLLEFKNETNLNNGMGDIYIYKLMHFNTE
jgi:hypothetical protein